MKPAKSEPGSYRDREGRVFYVGDEVYRALSQHAWDEWRALRDRPFFVEALEHGEVVGTGEADHPVPLPEELTPSPPVGILRHQRIPFVSYPYEWTFGMLQDAALLQLRLLRRALDDGFVLKDSSSYNVQWQGTRPVFIDVASFERHVEGDPWIGYLQFCQLFLYPLLINAYKDIPFQPLLRGSLDGIEPPVADALFSLRDRMRSGVLTHVHLQARLQRAHADRKDSVRSEVRRSGFSKQLILNNVRSLEKLVSGLSWHRPRSTWSEYGTDHGYSNDDNRAKEDFVRRAAERSTGRLLWDLGCNDGRFTRVAAPSFEYSVALDADALAVDRLYQRLRTEQESTWASSQV